MPDQDLLECDLIMKGGITSGVVYPKAITRVAKKYRLRSLGGTSAGAIGATFAAAAEYRRQQASSKEQAQDGFDALEAAAVEMGEDMGSLFQPSPKLRSLFGILMALVAAGGGSKLGRIVKGLILGYPGQVIIAALISIVPFGGGILTGSIALSAIGVLLFPVLGAVLIGWTLFATLTRDLPDHDFGLCSGKTQGQSTRPGFTNWIADQIDEIAGNVEPNGALGDPLTCGQLEDAGISIATMTTDLSSGRPFRLPMMTRIHWFSKSEFDALLPTRIVDALTRGKDPTDGTQDGGPHDLYKLPVGPDFPVVLVARMSLSFPGLIQAVPLYRMDHGLKGSEPNARAPWRRCLFSDGGISSNFPIHFFDATVPGRPTFGITLASWDPRRHGDTRVNLPENPRGSAGLPVKDIASLAGFAMSIVDTAKDWQDTLQARLPGYAERIVEIRLDDSNEGGMNLTMDKATIQKLMDYGEEAGEKLCEDFKFDEHRWRRAVTVLPEVEGFIEDFANAYEASPTGAPVGALTFKAILLSHDAKSYRDVGTTWRRKALTPFADALAALIPGTPPRDPVQGRQGLPTIDARLRFVADADRRPAE